MKTLYTIGETAKLLGITTQTLRHYEKIGILKPKKIDDQTGYRYYSFNQFHIIDRVKYLQGLGLNLTEIGNIINKGTVEGLLPALELEWQKSYKDLEKIQNRIKDIEWYIEYFTYLSNIDDSQILYHLHLPKRYIIQVPCYQTDELADMEIRLAEAKGSPRLYDLPYRRQYGYILSLPELFSSKFRPVRYFIYLKNRPENYLPEYKELPAGEYICFRTQILKEKWDTTLLRNFFADLPQPNLALALEFEDNLVEYQDAQYEVQIFKPDANQTLL